MPYLGAFLPKRNAPSPPCRRRHGAASRLAAEASLTALVEEDALPFPDVFFDRILMVHGLEGAENLRALLRQLWRVLAPEGRMLLVAPNRASLWAQVQRSPFGHGRPFSRSELDRLLRGALVRAGPLVARALCAAVRQGRSPAPAPAGKESARAVSSGLGGVHIVEAAKSLYAPATPAPALPR